MVHYGKHIIDHETGLCEICDRGAIHDFRQGKRPGRQFLYSNQDGKFTYRPNDDDTQYDDEPTPRYVRKPLYPEPPPPPPARTRPVVHEEPRVQKKVRQHNYSPYDDTQQSRPTTFYYVDNSGQMHPRNEGPPDEPRQRYLVQNPPTSTTRPARVTQRRAQTPPPVNESWRSRPKRQVNSDTGIVERQHQIKSHDPYFYDSPRKIEMYHIVAPYESNRNPPTSLAYTSHDNINNTPSPRRTYVLESNRKQRQLEPIERKHYPEPEPPVAKKVYKKLSPRRYEPPQEEYISNGNHPRPVRKIEKIYPTPKHYESSPQLTDRYAKSPRINMRPSIYHIQSVNEY